MKRAVITGLGIISSIGNNREEVLASLREGRSRITFSEEFKEIGMRSRVWGNVKLDTAGLIDRKTVRFMSDASVYAYLSMEQAIADSGLTEEQVSHYRTGVVAGSGGGSRALRLSRLTACVPKVCVVSVLTWCRVQWHPVCPQT